MRSLLFALLLSPLIRAQDTLPYAPEVNALASYAAALEVAQTSGKHLWVQLGQADCPACQRLYWFIEAHPETATPLQQHFIPLHIATSRQNIPLLRRWNSPQLDHGVPVILILDAAGNLLTIAPAKTFSAQVGEFSEAKLADFLKQWAPSAKPQPPPAAPPPP
jgi:hypothetical protein